MLQAWKQFIAGEAPGSAVSGAILESWQRCRAFNVDVARASLRRISYAELRGRLDQHAALVAAARPHLRAVLSAVEHLRPVVIMLTDPEGVILESVGNAPEVMSAFGLVPGYDWSERAMGTNGIGTALAFGAPVAVVGGEHYVQSWHNNTCVGAPIRSADGRILGAVDISTTARDGDPARLLLVSFLAHLIARELGVSPGGIEAFAGADTLARASGPGSSADMPALKRHALELDSFTERLAGTARLQQTPPPSDGEEVELGAMLSRLVGSLDAAHLTLPDQEPVLVRGARRQLEPALDHLLNLALRRSPRGVSVSAKLLPDHVQVEVAAIAASDANQAAPSQIDTAGLALGYWIARELLRSAGAELSVVSTHPVVCRVQLERGA